MTAGIRLDDALRGYLAEQGAKRLSKDDLWQLVMASMRLRLTAHSLAGLRRPAPDGPRRGAAALQQRAAELAAFYGVAAQVGLRAPGARAVGAGTWDVRLARAWPRPGAS